ncbi:restriction endonuclease subunit S [Serratia sp. OLHL2]|uniref:restriction endonuclease subunit S n=1 Tax=Serratia TaxID=613 RepID=UPI000C19D1A1|nr:MULTISPECIES: restriction endonuclease subunit S [unclassified Serratia (in: enterobacteria)]PII49191.1 restriction endonuclease subunit S [Serratia sp. OLEL1]PII56234.1 restriction endonuclease subunit S [Serratia sp. OLCL1]PII57686.1 restriction endonuclease subunit S [Serratia sp. OLHL2]PII63033.1 restriction endonuclease subunit S [Serratia sp. OLBL1]PII73479.1 restriction endonuclease subunit S [Serratia sp. OLIL2]
MSMDSKVPGIRFKGFSGEWEWLSFLDSIERIIDFRGRTPKKLGLDWSPSGYRALSALNVKQGYIDFSIDPHFGDQELYDKWMNGSELHQGQVLFTTEAPMGNVAQVPNTDKFILSQRTIAFIVKSEFIVEDFLAVLLRSSKVFRDLSALSSGGTAKGVSQKVLANLSVSIPNDLAEQATIGNYFQKLDDLINQHQQKHDKLRNIKKTMLEKMFPKQGETIPEIRFKGFSGEWDKKPFGACFVNVPNNTLSRADLNYKTGLAKNIHYGDVLIKFGEVLDARNELLPFITNDSIANKLNNSGLRDGDIIIADAAEDNTVGKCTELFNIEDQLILSGLHTIAVRPIFPFASKYLGYHLNSSSYHDQLLSLMQGTKVLSISKAAIKDTNIAFPKSLEEQAAIGTYFQNLDSLIKQNQQQITKLNNIKQACLSKMFV